jgi:predicted RNA-binding Zn ribbon-like protein
VVRLTPETIKLRGGALCLDFANSTDWTADEGIVETQDALVEPNALERWGVRLGVAGVPGGAEELQLARELREALHAIFSALARGEPADACALERLRSTYEAAVSAGSIARDQDGALRLEWPRDETRRVRFAVAADAVALLADPARLARVRRCPGRDCGWLFVDMSGRRRWCSMASCGSREKMRRLYARKRRAESAG